MASVTANLELLDRVWEEAVERGEMAVVDDVLADEYVLYTPGIPETIHGPEGFKQYKRTLHEAFPDLSVSIEDRIVGEEAVVDRYRIRGTHDGEFKGIAPTGTEVEFSGIIIHYIENGNVVKDIAEFNVLDIMYQLGVVEPPEE